MYVLFEFFAMRSRLTKRPVIATVVALLICFAPGTLGTFCASLATQQECCPNPCESHKVPVGPMAPASCCSVGNPEQRQALQITQSSIPKNSLDTLEPGFGPPPRLYFDLQRRGTTVLQALHQSAPTGSNLSAFLCTFLI